MDQPASETSNVLAFERAAPAGVRVLIVEDEMLIALNLIDMVEALGASSRAASRVASALTLIATQPFDAAIVDMNLCHEPADAVLDALSVRGIPFFITTGYGTEGIAEKYRGVPRLTKPYMPGQVETALLGLLAPSRLCAQSG
jgi:DNA-binding NtrC family response regulator